MLSRINRLKKKKEFNYIYKRGEVFHSHSFTMHVVRAYKRFPQIGISVSKAVGNSIVRSRVKRIFSEACRLNINRFAVKNYVITPKPISATKTSTEIARELMSVLKKNGLYRDV